MDIIIFLIFFLIIDYLQELHHIPEFSMAAWGIAICIVLAYFITKFELRKEQ